MNKDGILMLKIEKKTPKLLISTLDPRYSGGVSTMVEFAYKSAKLHTLSPRLCYLSLNPDDSFGIRKILSGKFTYKWSQIRAKSMDGTCIGYLFPEFEVFNYILTSLIYKKLINKSDIYLVASGTNQSGLPFLIFKKKFICWVATTYLDEYDSKLQVNTKLDLKAKVNRFLNKISLPVLLYFEKVIFKKSAKILALSAYTGNSITRQYNIDSKKLEVTNFPIDTNVFYPDKSTVNVGADYILLVARINDPRKNINLLLKSFLIVKEKFPDIKLVLAGDKPSNSLLSITDELNISKSIVFLEKMPREMLVDYYRGAKLFVLPSFQEGLGIVVLEAMACGTPIISTMCGGPEELIENSGGGMLVSAFSENELSKAIIELLEDDSKRVKMGKCAAEYIVKNHSIAIVSEIFAKSYQEVYPELFS